MSGEILIGLAIVMAEYRHGMDGIVGMDGMIHGIMTLGIGRHPMLIGHGTIRGIGDIPIITIIIHGIGDVIGHQPIMSAHDTLEMRLVHVIMVWATQRSTAFLTEMATVIICPREMVEPAVGVMAP